MKNILTVCAMCACLATTHAQFLKKLKDKVNKTIDKKIDKTVVVVAPASEIEKKENAAANEFSDATENHEKPIFVDKAPDNGKMVLKLKKSDRFSGGYIQLISQPKKDEINPDILDYINAKVIAFYPRGEITEDAIYINGKRILNDSGTISVRPEFIEYLINKTDLFTGTDAVITPATGFGTKQEDLDKMMKAGGYSNMSEADMEKMAKNAQAMAENIKGMTPEQQAAYLKKNDITPAGQNKKEMKEIAEALKNRTAPSVKNGTFTFKYKGKQYGPFTGRGTKMLVFKPMEDVTSYNKFYGLGAEPFIGEKEMGYNAIIQTEKKLIKMNDYVLGGLFEPTWPTGAMVVVEGKGFNFTNGKTIVNPQKPPYLADGQIVGVVIYGTDSGHIVAIPTTMEQMSAGGATTAYVDYKTKLSYPLVIDKEHLLITTDPAKSLFYKNHVLYYADGHQETIDNVGDAQLYSFNGKDYVLWFEMMNAADGHEIYVCQKELK